MEVKEVLTVAYRVRAVSLGFGILYATLLSLILVPAGYMVIEDIKGFFGAILRK